MSSSFNVLLLQQEELWLVELKDQMNRERFRSHSSLTNVILTEREYGAPTAAVTERKILVHPLMKLL